MDRKRQIDERDIDNLLSSLTDRQIAELFGMEEAEVAHIRRQRRNTPPTPAPENNGGETG